MELKLGRKIKKLRELRNYSQDYMASQLGLSQSAYSNIETNDAGLNTDRLEKIANLLEITVSDIENFDDRMIFNVHVQNNTDHSKNYGYINSQTNNLDEKIHEIHDIIDQRDRLKDDKIKLLEEKNALLVEQVEMLREKVRGLEGR